MSATTPTKPSAAKAALPQQDRHKPKGGPVRPSKMSRKRAWVLIAVHVLIALHFLHWGVTGSSVTPVEPSEAMQAVELGKVNAGFLLFVGLIATTLIFGRWFCGWACHVVALQDLSAWLLGRVGLKPRPLRSRLLVLAPWVVAGHMFVWPLVRHWIDPVKKPLPEVADWQWDLTTTDMWESFPQWIMAPLTFLVVGFLIVWWLGAKGFCTYGCPYGAFFAVADRFAPVTIKVTDACDACGHCTNVCTSNVRVHEEVAKHQRIVDPGCMKCLDCVSVCPKEALYVGVAMPKPFAVSQQRIQARADFTWPEEIALAVIAITATQWVFREAWFGEGVPFLLSVALGVITAVFALLFWRLLRRPAMTFQHTVLKADGRFRRVGWCALVLIGAWLGFAVHTGLGRHGKMAAIETAQPLLSTLFLRSAQNNRQDMEVAFGQVPSALAGVDGALAWDLVDDPVLLEYRGMLLHVLDRHAEAETALHDALAGRPGLSQAVANLVLARYCMDPMRKRYDEARQLLEFTIEHHPGNRAASNLLVELDALQK